MKRLGLVLAFLGLLIGNVFAQGGMMPGPGTAHSSGGGGCTQATSFLARVTVDATHQTAYTTMICGLVTDGIFAKLDALYVFATQNTTAALTNIIQNNYNGTISSTPAFTVDSGYNGTLGYVNTNFNPTTATTPNFTQNSAAVFAWTNSTTGNGPIFGYPNTAGHLYLYPASSSVFLQINDGFFGGTATQQGLWALDRDTSTSVAAYKFGTSFSTGSGTSAAPQNDVFGILNGDSHNSFTGNAMAGGFGGHLTAANHTSLCQRLNVYLNTIAGVSSGSC